MDAFFKMDVFFLVTTLAVAVVGTLLSIGLFRILRILSDIETISKTVAEESKLVRADIADLRIRVRTEGLHIMSFYRATRRLLQRFFRTKEPTMRH